MNAQEFANGLAYPCVFWAGVGCPGGQTVALLDGTAPEAYRAARNELRGDLLVQLGRIADARKAYEQARDQLSESSATGSLMMKLDDLSTGDA